MYTISPMLKSSQFNYKIKRIRKSKTSNLTISIINDVSLSLISPITHSSGIYCYSTKLYNTLLFPIYIYMYIYILNICNHSDIIYNMYTCYYILYYILYINYI